MGLLRWQWWERTSLPVSDGEGNGKTHSSVLAWRIPGTEEPGGLPSMGSHGVGHDWSDLACVHALEKEMATHSSVLAWRIPGMGGALWAAVHGVSQSRTRLKPLSSSSSSQCRRHKRHGFNPWVWKIPWRRKWQPTPVFPLGESPGQRSLEGYSSRGCKESDTAERLST